MSTATFRKLQLPQSARGRVYLHSMPGRREAWSDFVAAAEAAKLDGVVCLADDSEIARKSPDYERALQEALPYEVHRLPIPDFGVPENYEEFLEFVQSIADRVHEGECLLVHCGAGVGRTGTFASCLLLVMGQGLHDARTAVRSAGSNPEVPEQHALVQRVASSR